MSADRKVVSPTEFVEELLNLSLNKTFNLATVEEGVWRVNLPLVTWNGHAMTITLSTSANGYRLSDEATIRSTEQLRQQCYDQTLIRSICARYDIEEQNHCFIREIDTNISGDAEGVANPEFLVKSILEFAFALLMIEETHAMMERQRTARVVTKNG